MLYALKNRFLCKLLKYLIIKKARTFRIKDNTLGLDYLKTN